MFKNYLLKFVFVFLFLFAFTNHSFGYTLTANSCIATSTNYNITVVSQIDLNGNIPLCVSANNNLPINIFLSGTPPLNIHTTTTSGQDHFNYPKNFTVADFTNTAGTVLSFIATDNTGNNGNANATVYVSPAVITLTPSPNIVNGGTIMDGTSESFLCTNSTEMYWDPVVGQTNTPVATDYNGSTGYNLIYNITPTLGHHKVECDNIGAGLTRKTLEFDVISADMSGTITAPNCTIADGASACSTTVSWHTYNPVATSAVTSETSGSGASSPNNVISTTNNGSQNVNVPYIVMGSHQGRNFYLYNNAISLAQATAVAECAAGSSWDGSKCTNSPTNCPSGQANFGSGCESICSSNPSIPASSSQCDSSNQASCALPNYWIVSASGGTCAQCPSGTAYNATTQSCNNLPYTHFLSFNVSAGYVAKGAGIDMNWSIQKPDASCKIIGVAIKTGAQVFNSADNSSVNDSVTGGSTNPTLSAGSLKAKTGSYFTVNQSTRFTASCITPVGSYNPGYHQLVRDVYLTGDSER